MNTVVKSLEFQKRADAPSKRKIPDTFIIELNKGAKVTTQAINKVSSKLKPIFNFRFRMIPKIICTGPFIDNYNIDLSYNEKDTLQIITKDEDITDNMYITFEDNNITTKISLKDFYTLANTQDLKHTTMNDCLRYEYHNASILISKLKLENKYMTDMVIYLKQS